MQLKVKNGSFYYVFSFRKNRRKTVSLPDFLPRKNCLSYLSNLHLVNLQSFRTLIFRVVSRTSPAAEPGAQF